MDRKAVWGIGEGEEGAPPVAISAKAGCKTGTEAAAGMIMVFWQVGQAI